MTNGTTVTVAVGNPSEAQCNRSYVACVDLCLTDDFECMSKCSSFVFFNFREIDN